MDEGFQIFLVASAMTKPHVWELSVTYNLRGDCQNNTSRENVKIDF